MTRAVWWTRAVLEALVEANVKDCEFRADLRIKKAIRWTFRDDFKICIAYTLYHC